MSTKPNKNVVDIGIIDKKSDLDAEKFRMEGNECYRQKKWEKSMEMYTKSLCFAVTDTFKGMALGNRSAAFLKLNMIDQCLLDIEIAEKDSGYMTQMMRSRKVCASDHKSTSKSVVSATTAAEVSTVQLPDKLVCKYDSHFGRGLYAARNISHDEQILAEDGFVFLLSPDNCYQKCDFCWRSYMNFIPCSECTDTVFCDAECLKKAAYFHANECGQNKKYSESEPRFNIIISRSFRSLFYAIDSFGGNVLDMWNFFTSILYGKDIGRKLPDNLSNPIAKYAFFLTLGVAKPAGVGDEFFPIFLKKMGIGFYMNKKWLSQYSLKEQIILHDIFLYHMHILMANSFATKISACSFSSVCYLFASLFNHHCSPNAYYSFAGNKITVTSTRQIMKNEQVFIAYYNDEDTDERREYLKNCFGFDCQCDFCVTVGALKELAA